MKDNQGIFETFIADGRPLLLFVALSLALSGAFALFLSASGQFLPQDTQFLGMNVSELCQFFGCRVVDFMFHDRVAFGGTLIAIGLLYMWLTEFPLRAGEAWAWWAFLLSGAVGFASFLTYLGYGYLDTWHGIATLLLLPCFTAGLAKTYRLMKPPNRLDSLLRPGTKVAWLSSAGLGRAGLLAVALGLIGAGLTIMLVGMTVVFVPEDLAFMAAQVEDLRSISPRLVPLIAHDRAGFGGGLASAGVAMLFCVWCARPAKSLWQTLCLAGCAGFGCAIATHFAVGYTDFIHLLPAYLGAILFGASIALSYKAMVLRP